MKKIFLVLVFGLTACPVLNTTPSVQNSEHGVQDLLENPECYVDTEQGRVICPR